jgi:hypothetical protein
MDARAKHDSANSPGNATNRVLGILTVAEIKAFLMDCANLPNPIDYPDHRPHFERWLKRWQRLFRYKAEVEVQVDAEDRTEDSYAKWEPVQVPREQLELFAPIVRTTLCRVWGERDARQRDWYCYRLRDAHRQMVRRLEGWKKNAIWGGSKTAIRLTDYSLQDVPGICPFEAAIYWLQLNHTLMLYCGGPSCEAPYFFRTERRQKFCSPECADPARREAKLKWWNESPNSPKNLAGKNGTKRGVRRG